MSLRERVGTLLFLSYNFLSPPKRHNDLDRWNILPTCRQQDTSRQEQTIAVLLCSRAGVEEVCQVYVIEAKAVVHSIYPVSMLTRQAGMTTSRGRRCTNR